MFHRSNRLFHSTNVMTPNAPKLRERESCEEMGSVNSITNPEPPDPWKEVCSALTCRSYANLTSIEFCVSDFGAQHQVSILLIHLCPCPLKFLKVFLFSLFLNNYLFLFEKEDLHRGERERLSHLLLPSQSIRRN